MYGQDLSKQIVQQMKRQIKLLISQIEKNGANVNLGKRAKGKPIACMKETNQVEQSRSHQKNQTKYRYIPPQVKQKKMFILPQENDFIKDALQYLKPFKALSEVILKHDFRHLFAIFKEVEKRGGIIEILSVGEFSSITKEVLSSQRMKLEQIKQILNQKCLTILQQLFFTIEFLRRNPEEKKKLYSLGMVTFANKEDFLDAMKSVQKGLSYFNHDLTVFQEGAQAMGFTHDIFNLTLMCQYYASQTIDIRIQNPCDYGFNVRRLKNKAYEMTLADYRFYQLNYQDPVKMAKFKHVDQLGKGQVFFGVNFEPHDQMLNREVKKLTDKNFLDFHADFDMLSYLDADVPGCSIPQMYFKVPGCWTGGHQQNIAMSALNINHGPGYSEWFTLDLKYIEKLRSELKSEYKIDLYEQEGLWYQDLDWFISHGYPVKRFLQRKDDIVVTGPGTLHWVRSFGLALQTSWNMMPKTLEQFEAAFHRQEENEKIKFQKGNVIPLKAITLKYLNHERKTMRRQIKDLCFKKIKEWEQSERKILNENNPDTQACMVKNLNDLYSFCDFCFQQVYLFYLPMQKSSSGDIICLKCYFSDEHEIKESHKVKKLYCKYDQYHLQALYNRLENQQSDKGNEIIQLCSGEHVGRVPCARNSAMLEQKPPMRQHDFLNAERSLFYKNEKLRKICEKTHSDQKKKKTGFKTFSIQQPMSEFLEKGCQTEKVKMIEIAQMIDQGAQCDFYNEILNKCEKGSQNENGKQKRNQNLKSKRKDWKQYSKNSQNEGKPRNKGYCTEQKKRNQHGRRRENDDNNQQTSKKKQQWGDDHNYLKNKNQKQSEKRNNQFRNQRRNETRNERKTVRSNLDDSSNYIHNKQDLKCLKRK